MRGHRLTRGYLFAGYPVVFHLTLEFPTNLPLPYSNSLSVFLTGVTARHIMMVRIELSGVFGSSPARVPGLDGVDNK